MILLVVLMLSAEAGSGAVTSIEDPEPPSGNDSEPLRAGLWQEARREAPGREVPPSCAAPLRARHSWVRGPETAEAPSLPRFTRHFGLFFAKATTQTFSV